MPLQMGRSVCASLLPHLEDRGPTINSSFAGMPRSMNHFAFWRTENHDMHYVSVWHPGFQLRFVTICERLRTGSSIGSGRFLPKLDVTKRYHVDSFSKNKIVQ